MSTPPQKQAYRKLAPRKPARPEGLAHGRWLGDFADLSEAELRLVECCGLGLWWEPEGWHEIGPKAIIASNTIRADLIRFLALGGDAAHPVHEMGVMLAGGWITGKLDFYQCTAVVMLDLQCCHFTGAPDFRGSVVPELVLSGSIVPGFSAVQMKVAGSVFLRNGFTATGEVRLLDAEIGGNLECGGGNFVNVRGSSLITDRMKVAGSVFLRAGFTSMGEVRLLGAEIGGNLVCTNGAFNNTAGRALTAQGIKTEVVFLQKAKVEGAIDLTAARIGTLMDDANCWQAGGHILDGLQYDRIIGPTNALSRIAWLESQRADQLNSRDWAPQPWEQLVKILREMGHPAEAAEVAMAKQVRMRKAGKIVGPVRKTLHWLYGLLAGYGYRPLNAVQAMMIGCLACAFFFQVGGSYGYIGPSTPLLNSPALSAAVEAQCGHRFETGKTVWTECPAMPAEYTTFQPLLYSLDLILPLVDLQQESDWSPVVEDPPGHDLPFGVFLRWLMWFEILFGWGMSLMLVAVLGKLVEKD